MGILESIALTGLTKLTGDLISKFSELGWNKVVEDFEASFSHEDLVRFCNACDEYVNIRTLYSSQRDVFIDDVYVPLYMSPINDPDSKYEISNLRYYSGGITNIIGKAGQGKSTFLRKILINELKEGNAIPVFFELKYLNNDGDLLSQISIWFERHNLSISPKGVSRLLKHGAIKVFLDGFDEIKPSFHDEALGLIKDLSRAYPKTTVVVTSRPDTLITTEPYISNYQVLDLTDSNVRQLFLNISNNNKEKADEAMEQLDKYPSINSVAKTPILAILLFLTYRTWSKVPDNLSDFYKKIFITLLTHHDSLKPGKKIDRGINISLNDHQIEDVFCAFCFLTFSDDFSVLTTRQASEYMSQALSSECIEGVCDQEIVDIIKSCTGILCGDGYDQITFSHKSLQEYYASVYIAKQSLSDKRTYYHSVKCAPEERKYDAVLKFLSSVDRKDYIRYYYIPCYKEMFETSSVRVSIDESEAAVAMDKVIKSVEIPINMADDFGSKEKKVINIGLRFEVGDDHSTLFYIRLMQPLLFCLLKSLAYVDYVKNCLPKSTDKDTCSAEEFVVGLEELLESVSESKRNDFFEAFESEFDSVVGENHEYMMRFYNKQSKPSLLSQAFRK
ncbi:NACHT domain-containing protein [Marinobacter nauticus]